MLSLGELRDMLREHSREYSHFAEHARFLDGHAPCSDKLYISVCFEHTCYALTGSGHFGSM